MLLSLADEELFTPKWSEQIHREWMRNVVQRLMRKAAIAEPEAWQRVERVRAAFERTHPDAGVAAPEAHLPVLARVPADDRHVVLTAMACRADAICTANLQHFPAEALDPLGLQAIHPDDFIRDLIDLDAARAARAIKTMRARMKAPPMTVPVLAERLAACQLTQTALWVTSEPVVDLI